MADIVFAAGVPHTPAFPALVAQQGPGCETARLFGAVRTALEDSRPDCLVLFDTDHLNTFFFDNLPVFAIGVAASFGGPNDEMQAVRHRTIRSDLSFAEHIRNHCVASDFDLAHVEQFEVDHSMIVPLHFLLPELDLSVVPIFIGGHVPPLPSSRRCFALGEAVCAAIRRWPGRQRVAVIGSGSFSLDVFGTRTAPGQSYGVPDPDWAAAATDLIRRGAYDELIAGATAEQLARAGNVGGEILNWIAMLAAVEGKPPDLIASQEQFGHGYAAWRLG
jgi:gallate dioxygenase